MGHRYTAPMSSPSANLEGLSERTVLRVSAVIAVASVMARRPDALFAPQFSWEDGPEWYQVARNFGFKSVGRVYNGYLGVPQRLAGLLVQPLPLRYAPLAFAVIAIIIQALPAIYIMSERCVALHPSRGVRAVIALIYLWIPGSTDTNSNLAHVQWYL